MTLSSAALLAMSAMNPVAGNIEPGKPAGGGVDFVWIHDNGGWHLVPVDINPGMTINDKALAIQTAINDAGYSASTTSNGSVSIAGTNGTDKWEYHSHTGEKDQTGNIQLVGKPTLYAMGFDGTPTGVGIAGFLATYSASISFDSVTASSTVAFSSLADQTLDGLLTATFNNLHDSLPIANQGYLTLDLATATIHFQDPGTLTNVEISTQSLDAGTGSFIGAPATAAPEPSPAALMGIGAAAIVVSRLLRRRLTRPPAHYGGI